MRWKYWFPQRSKDAEIDEEIQSHLRMAIQDRIDRGESPQQARTSALREFGNAGLVQEDTRAVWVWVALERLLQDLKYALRQMRRSPGFSGADFGLWTQCQYHHFLVDQPSVLAALADQRRRAARRRAATEGR